MSILQLRYCPVCHEKTYHRYNNALRSDFTPASTWQCVSCEARAMREHRRQESMDMPVSVPTHSSRS